MVVGWAVDRGGGEEEEKKNGSATATEEEEWRREQVKGRRKERGIHRSKIGVKSYPSGDNNIFINMTKKKRKRKRKYPNLLGFFFNVFCVCIRPSPICISALFLREI